MSAQTMMGYAAVHAGVTHSILESSSEHASIQFSREGYESRTVEFDLEEAKSVGLYPGRPGSAWNK